MDRFYRQSVIRGEFKFDYETVVKCKLDNLVPLAERNSNHLMEELAANISLHWGGMNLKI